MQKDHTNLEGAQWKLWICEYFSGPLVVFSKFLPLINTPTHVTFFSSSFSFPWVTLPFLSLSSHSTPSDGKLTQLTCLLCSLLCTCISITCKFHAVLHPKSERRSWDLPGWYETKMYLLLLSIITSISTIHNIFEERRRRCQSPWGEFSEPHF